MLEQQRRTWTAKRIDKIGKKIFEVSEEIVSISKTMNQLDAQLMEASRRLKDLKVNLYLLADDILEND